METPQVEPLAGRPEPCRMEPTEHEKAEWSRMATKCYAKGHNALGTRMSVAASVRQHGTIPIENMRWLQNAYRDWLCFDEYADPDTMGQGVIPGAEAKTPREMLQRQADAKPKPRPDQDGAAPGGLFDARGPLPLQTDLLED